METERVPPHSIEAERAVFGSILIKPVLADQLASVLTADDFFLPAHREMFDAVTSLVKRKRPVDIIAIAEELKSAGQLSKLEGGTSYLTVVAEATPTAEHAQHYAQIVRGKADVRRLISHAGEIMSAGYGNPVDPAAFMQESVEKITTVARREDRSRTESIVDIFEAMSGDIEAIQLGKKLAFVPTGLEAIDELLGGGMFPEWLVVPCAQTSIGKTSFGVQVAFRNARAFKIPTLIFTLEMTKRQMLVKGLANLLRVNSHCFNPPKVGGKADWETINQGAAIAEELQHLIQIEEHRNIGQLVAVSHAWRARHPGMAMILVDQIQKVVGVRTKNSNRQEEVWGVASALKNLAKDLKVPVVAPGQVDNDAVKQERAPRIGDIRDSKAIEHEADVVIGLHRNRMAERGTVEVILLKNRGGQVKKRTFQWEGAWQGFEPREHAPDRHDDDDDDN